MLDHKVWASRIVASLKRFSPSGKYRLNAYDGNGIAAHVTERFRQSAEDQVFIANGLGSQVDIEKISAVDPCGIEICHVNITARISGSQLAGADDLEIKLTYVVKKVNGAALVDDVLN
jgi:hypothetical protein